MPITQSYLVKVQSVFWKGYERSLRYEQEKDKLFAYVTQVVEKITDKIGESELGSTVDELLTSLQGASWFTDFKTFKKNVNSFIANSRFSRKRLSDYEIEFIWILHTKGFVQNKDHKLAKFLDLLGNEAAFIDKTQNFIEGLNEKLKTEAVQTSQVQNITLMLDHLGVYAHELEGFTRSEMNCLRTAHVEGLLEARKSEMKLRDNIQKAVEPIMKKQKTFKKHFGGVSVSYALRLGVVIICLAVVLSSNVLASTLTRKAFPGSYFPHKIELVVQDIRMKVFVEWENVELAEHVTKDQVAQTVIEAVKYAASQVKGNNLPSNMFVRMGLGDFETGSKNHGAIYLVRPNKIYVNPVYIKKFATDDANLAYFYSIIVHEAVHAIDFNMNPNTRQDYITFENWLRGERLPEDSVYFSRVIESVLKFDEDTEVHAMEAQLNFLKMILREGWKQSGQLTAFDKAAQQWILERIQEIKEMLDMVRQGKYGNKRAWARQLVERYEKTYGITVAIASL